MCVSFPHVSMAIQSYFLWPTSARQDKFPCHTPPCFKIQVVACALYIKFLLMSLTSHTHASSHVEVYSQLMLHRISQRTTNYLIKVSRCFFFIVRSSNWNLWWHEKLLEELHTRSLHWKCMTDKFSNKLSRVASYESENLSFINLL